jgi:hypothetical protein
MLDQPQITLSASQSMTIIRSTNPREEIRNVMGRDVAEVMSAIAAQGIAHAGTWLNRSPELRACFTQSSSWH